MLSVAQTIEHRMIGWLMNWKGYGRKWSWPVLKLKVSVFFIIRVMGPDDSGSKHHWNIGKLLPDYMVQQPRRQLSSYSLLWEPEISPNLKLHVLKVEPTVLLWTGSILDDANWYATDYGVLPLGITAISFIDIVRKVAYLGDFCYHINPLPSFLIYSIWWKITSLYHHIVPFTIKIQTTMAYNLHQIIVYFHGYMLLQQCAVCSSKKVHISKADSNLTSAER
jgi:hypothetical protein